MSDELETNTSRIVYFINTALDIIDRKSHIFNNIKLKEAEKIDKANVEKIKTKEQENIRRRRINTSLPHSFQTSLLPITNITAKNSEISNTVICCDQMAEAIIIHISYLLILALNNNEPFYQKSINSESGLIAQSRETTLSKEKFIQTSIETIVTTVLYCYYQLVLNEQTGADLKWSDCKSNVPYQSFALFLHNHLIFGDIDMVYRGININISEKFRQMCFGMVTTKLGYGTSHDITTEINYLVYMLSVWENEGINKNDLVRAYIQLPQTATSTRLILGGRKKTKRRRNNKSKKSKRYQRRRSHI